MDKTKRSAKEIKVAPIPGKQANLFVKHWHYSGSVMQSSSLHLGAFLDEKLHGVMQFGSCIDKRKIQPLVEGTHWNGFLELNRMAFDDHLPKNSESRALSIAFKLIRKHYPHIKWVISFADACQCGDGTIYRASGFDLIGIKKNKTMMRLPDGTIVADKTLNSHPVQTAHWWRKRGATELPGFQIRYIYFIDKSMRKNLTVPILPYSAIEDAGASMYLGQAREVGDDPAPPGTAAVQR